MPLTKRSVSPVNVSLHRLPASVHRDELECVANGTLANLVRQLSSLSRQAEHIFGEIYHEAVKIDHKTNTLSQRIERLKQKVSQLDCGQQQVALEDSHLRKPFKSSCLIDQHTLDRQTLPSSLAECYNLCDSPPNLDALNPYRDDKKSALRYYTDPSYFFDLWRQEMLKDVGDGRRRNVRSPTHNKSPSRKKRTRLLGKDESYALAPPSRYIVASQQRPAEIMNFPAEYQAPQIVNVDPIHIPVGMSVPVNNGFTPIAKPASSSSPIVTESTDRSVPSNVKEVGNQLAHLEIHDGSLLDDDDDLPPPPPPLMHTSLVCQMPNAPPIQYVAPSEKAVTVPPSHPPPSPPPPPPPASLTSTSTSVPNSTTVVQSFANSEEAKVEKPSIPQSRLDLLAEIQSGIKLKQVQRKEQAAEEKAANDVAAILRRRMEHVLGPVDSGSETPSDEEEWD